MRGIRIPGNFVLAAIVCAWAISRAAADVAIVPFSQTRSISAQGSWTPTAGTPVSSSQTKSASNFLLFDDSVSILIQDTFLRSSASAMQDSEMSALSVRADGSGNSTSSGSGISGAATAAGNSMFSFTFDLLEPTAFTLQGTVTYSATFAGHAVTTVGLSDMTGPPTSIFFVQQNSASGTPPPNNIPFSTSGTLLPGRYKLLASSVTDADDNSTAPNPVASSSYSLVFNVPEPSVGLMMIALGMLGRKRLETGRKCADRFNASR